jgi:hypothetical protein
MNPSPESLYLVIAVLSVALVAASARLFVLHLRARRADKLLSQVAAVIQKLGPLCDKCSLLAHNAGRAGEFRRGLVALADARGLAWAAGNPGQALSLAQRFEVLVLQWIADLERSPGAKRPAKQWKLAEQPPLQVVRRSQTGATPGIAKGHATDVIIETRIADDGSVVLILHLPWGNAGNLVFFPSKTDCTVSYGGRSSRVRLNGRQLLNLPDVRHPLADGMNVIKVREHGVLAGWEKPRLHLKLQDLLEPPRPR